MQGLMFNLNGKEEGGGFHITGKTFAVKEHLKALGATWQPSTKSWFIKDPQAYEKLKQPKPWWFCGCEGAKIISMKSQMHSCAKCAGHRALDGEMYFVRGGLHTGD